MTKPTMIDAVIRDEPIPAAYTFEEYSIPEYSMTGLKNYIQKGLHLRGFLLAVVCNDLMGAVAYADSHNIKNLPAYAEYLRNEAPEDCHGSIEKYEAWIAQYRKRNSRVTKGPNRNPRRNHAGSQG